MSIVGVSREYKRLSHVGVVDGQGVRSLRGCVEEGFIDVEKQHAEDDEADLSQVALESGRKSHSIRVVSARHAARPPSA